MTAIVVSIILLIAILIFFCALAATIALPHSGHFAKPLKRYVKCLSFSGVFPTIPPLEGDCFLS